MKKLFEQFDNVLESYSHEAIVKYTNHWTFCNDERMYVSVYEKYVDNKRRFDVKQFVEIDCTHDKIAEEYNDLTYTQVCDLLDNYFGYKEY